MGVIRQCGVPISDNEKGMVFASYERGHARVSSMCGQNAKWLKGGFSLKPTFYSQRRV